MNNNTRELLNSDKSPFSEIDIYPNYYNLFDINSLVLTT